MSVSSANLVGYIQSTLPLAPIATFISNILTSGGWIQTSDTGQTASASFGSATGTVASLGYQIWCMNDSLQGTYPVFVKLEYGAGWVYSPSYNYPNAGVWVTIGTGSNGSGTITGIICARQLVTWASNVTGNGASCPSYTSASSNRLCCTLFVTYNPIGFGIERTKTSTGTDATDGVLFSFFNNAGMYTQYCPFTGTIRAANLSSFDLTTAPTDLSDGVGNIAIIPPFILGQYGPTNYGNHWMFYVGINLPAYNIVTANIRGTNHNYITLGTLSGFLFTNSSTMMLYE